MPQVSASDQTWRLAEAYWKRCQNDDGSWGYNQQNHNFNGTGSMTCAGITSLVIAMDRVQPPDARVVGDRIECCVPRKTGGADDVDRIERGIQWLGQHYSVSTNPGRRPLAGSTTSTASSASAGSPRGGSFPCLPGWARPSGPTGIAKGPTIWSGSKISLSGFWRGNGPGETEPVIGTSRWPCCSSRRGAGPCC